MAERFRRKKGENDAGGVGPPSTDVPEVAEPTKPQPEPRRRRRYFLFGPRKSLPEGLWVKCEGCDETIYNEELQKRLYVCPKCGHHFRLGARDRIETVVDEGSFREFAHFIETPDPLEFVDSKPYPEKIASTREKSGEQEGIVVGDGRIRGRDVVVGAMEFRFLGGSMGVVVGEKVTAAVERAMERGVPLILFAASGGARMHEGALSLMQMGKTCSALARLDSAGGFYIAVLCNPTTGGVTASFATTADLVLAEPGALIGFAGPRVIKQTIKQDLPKGFQTSEFLLQRGQVDRIVPRDRIRDELSVLLSYMPKRAGGGTIPGRSKQAPGETIAGGVSGAEPGVAGLPAEPVRPADVDASEESAGSPDGERSGTRSDGESVSSGGVSHVDLDEEAGGGNGKGFGTSRLPPSHREA